MNVRELTSPRVVLTASCPVRELSSPRVVWPRVGLSASCPVSILSSRVEWQTDSNALLKSNDMPITITYGLSISRCVTVCSTHAWPFPGVLLCPAVFIPTGVFTFFACKLICVKMSIFRASKDSTADDSVSLTCTIESAYNLKDHTVRHINCFCRC